MKSTRAIERFRRKEDRGISGSTMQNSIGRQAAQAWRRLSHQQAEATCLPRIQYSLSENLGYVRKGKLTEFSLTDVNL
jgi:hypothetical protein